MSHWVAASICSRNRENSCRSRLLIFSDLPPLKQELRPERLTQQQRQPIPDLHCLAVQSAACSKPGFHNHVFPYWAWQVHFYWWSLHFMFRLNRRSLWSLCRVTCEQHLFSPPVRWRLSSYCVHSLHSLLLHSAANCCSLNVPKWNHPPHYSLAASSVRTTQTLKAFIQNCRM